MKGGVAFLQTLSLNDINSIVNDQTYDISNIQTEFSDGFNIGMITRVSLPLIPVYVMVKHSTRSSTKLLQSPTTGQILR